jgi:hypothetical protein
MTDKTTEDVEEAPTLLELAQAKAPSLTAEFVAEHDITDEELAQIARGELSPPPTVGPIPSTVLHRAPGTWSWTNVAAGVALEDAGAHKGR